MSERSRPLSWKAVGGACMQKRSRRSGFTLIELLISIVIIGILAGLVLGALQQAAGRAKQIHTRSTIAKLSASVTDRWESYRTRRVNIDPMNVALGMKNGYFGNAYNAIISMANRRIGNSGGTVNAYPAQPYDALSVPASAVGVFPTSAQIAAIRLLALRDLQRYEMPTFFSDFADMNGTPGSFQLRTPDVLGTYVAASNSVQAQPPGLAYAYLAALNKATTTDINQIKSNETAECLYMMLTIGTSDDAVSGERPVSLADIGDVDGDGLPEFQDSWPVQNSHYATTSRANSPINWLRWPAGVVSPLQEDPFPVKLGQVINGTPATQADIDAAVIQFGIAHHDFLDPLKLDVAGGSSPVSPRGIRLTPLIYSAGPDGSYDINFGNGLASDPYDASNGLAGVATGPGAVDDITSHDIEER